MLVDSVSRSRRRRIERKLLERSREDKNGCWIWIGSEGGRGHGHLRWNGRIWYAHRLAAFLWLGFDPDSGLWVLHKGDCNKLCINPDHLYIGTHADNTQDYYGVI